MCRDKLKSFHEYYTFVLDNQKTFKHSVDVFGNFNKPNTEFIGVVKEEPISECKPTPVDFVLDFKEDDRELSDFRYESDSDRPRRKKKKRIQKPRKYVVAIQKQQSDLMSLLFDFTCSACSNCPDFETYRGIYNHYKKVHKKAKTWVCCDKELKRDCELIEHVLEHQGEWKCKSCPKKPFKSAIELWKHRNHRHNEPSPIPYENPKDWLKPQVICDLCGKKFRTVTIIVRHMKDVHIKNYTCYICQAEFYHKYD